MKQLFIMNSKETSIHCYYFYKFYLLFSILHSFGPESNVVDYKGNINYNHNKNRFEINFKNSNDYKISYITSLQTNDPYLDILYACVNNEENDYIGSN